MSKTAIILVPLCVDVDDDHDAEELCTRIDSIIALNHESLLERMGVEGEGKQLNRNRFMNSRIIGYVKWPFEE